MRSASPRMLKSLAVKGDRFHTCLSPGLVVSSATHAIVMPPTSESLKRSRKVPFGQDISISCALFLLTKPMMELKERKMNIMTHPRGFSGSDTSISG